MEDGHTGRWAAEYGHGTVEPGGAGDSEAKTCPAPGVRKGKEGLAALKFLSPQDQ